MSIYINMHDENKSNSNQIGQTSCSSPKWSSWLPSQRPQLLLTQTLTLEYIKSNKPHDWFLSLAWELDQGQRTDVPQGEKLARIYLFLRDFIPMGLSGSHAHISGNDVMRYLFSDANEGATSQHKLICEAENAFKELEAWMGGNNSWADALQDATHADGGADGRVPGLQSPAGMLAILVLSYPDAEFLRLFGRLQVQWMLDSREDLNVTEGFWKGINAQNVEQVFQREQACEAKGKLLLDYNQILGEKFLECRREGMRAFLPSCLPLALEGPPDLADLVEADNVVSKDTQLAADSLATHTTNLQVRGDSNRRGSCAGLQSTSASSLPSPDLSFIHLPGAEQHAETTHPSSGEDVTFLKISRPPTPAAVTQPGPDSPGLSTQGTPHSAASASGTPAPVSLLAERAGKTPTKRPCSTERDAAGTARWLSDITPPELQDETKLNRDMLKPGLQAWLRAELVEEQEKLPSETLADTLAKAKAQLATNSERLDAYMQTSISQLADQTSANHAKSNLALQTDFQVIQHAVQEVLDNLNSIGEKARGGTQASQEEEVLMQDDLDRLVVKVQDRMSRHAATQSVVLEEMNHISDLLFNFWDTPKLGDAGYLKSNCLAPAGMDQNIYESRLFDAGVYCWHTLGGLDGGVATEQEAGQALKALQATAKEFPEIPDDHLQMAIQQVYCQLYRNP